MDNRNYVEKDVFHEHSKFMERFLAKMDEDRRDAREERRLAEERLKEERKEAEARLSEERRIAEERLKEERKEAKSDRRSFWIMYLTVIITIIVAFVLH